MTALTVALLFATRAAAMSSMPAVGETGWATLAPLPVIDIGGAVVPDSQQPLLDSQEIFGPPTPPLSASLVYVNRIERAECVARCPAAATNRDFDGEKTGVVAALRAASDSTSVDLPFADGVAVLPTPIEAERPQKAQARNSRDRKFWPRTRPLHRQVVWLSRKQP